MILARRLTGFPITGRRISGKLLGDTAVSLSQSVFSFNQRMLALPAALQAMGATFTRASADTVLQGGQLITLANDQFATDQDTDGGYDYVAQPAATNLCLRSTLEGGGAAPTGWIGASTGTSAPATSLLGSASNAVAYLHTATAQRPFLAQTAIAVSASTTYTFSFYVESVSGGLTAQDVIKTSGAPVGAVESWPVCQANPSGGAGGTVTTGRLVIQLVVSTTAGTSDFRMGIGCIGNATGTIQFSRPQLETGTRATSYIPTTAATATRAAAVLSVPLANIPGFSSAQYTLFADCRQDTQTSTDRRVLAVNDGTTNNRIYLAANSANQHQTLITSGGAAQANTSDGPVTTARYRSASSVALNNLLTAINGAAGSSDNTVLMPVSPTTLDIGCFATANQFNGRIRRAGIITTALTQAQINGLTA